MDFAFENLDVYKKSVQWAATVEALGKSLRSQASHSLIDQLTRAALSIPLNIAEGNGRWHKAEKRQFIWIARGSTFECVPILQVLRENNLIDDMKYREFREQLIVVGKMLNGLLKSIEQLKESR
jgi:four helix bundle protein